MNETSKAMRRRALERHLDWDSVFKGRGLDIGCGDDLLTGSEGFDKNNGDASKLSEYFTRESFNFLHASHLLEHLPCPTAALLDWYCVLKPGGCVVVTVPDFGLYEKQSWPSRFNPDHKTAWSVTMPSAANVPLVFVPDFLKFLKPQFETLECKLVSAGYNKILPPSIDQTRGEYNAECAIEFVLRKL